MVKLLLIILYIPSILLFGLFSYKKGYKNRKSDEQLADQMKKFENKEISEEEFREYLGRF